LNPDGQPQAGFTTKDTKNTKGRFGLLESDIGCRKRRFTTKRAKRTKTSFSILQHPGCVALSCLRRSHGLQLA
jgi:hypothetical protein